LAKFALNIISIRRRGKSR